MVGRRIGFNGRVGAWGSRGEDRKGSVRFRRNDARCRGFIKSWQQIPTFILCTSVYVPESYDFTEKTNSSRAWLNLPPRVLQRRANAVHEALLILISMSLGLLTSKYTTMPQIGQWIHYSILKSSLPHYHQGQILMLTVSLTHHPQYEP